MTGLFAPEDCCVALIDFQPQMLFAVQSHDRNLVINNVTALAKSAKAFGVPTILSTIGAKGFAGPMFKEIQEVFSGHETIDRSSMNAWEDENFLNAVKATGRQRMIMAGLWTEVCLAFPVLDALEAGFDVGYVTDASGGVSVEAHHMACHRMNQAGASPLTWMQLMCEWQRDWARKETAASVRDIALMHAGAYGQGLFYAHEMYKSREGVAAASSSRQQTDAPPARH